MRSRQIRNLIAMRSPLIFSALVASGSVGNAQVRESRPIDWNALALESQRVLSDYLRINTTNPPGNEMKGALFLKRILEKEGFEVQLLDSTELGPGRVNLYTRLKGQRLEEGDRARAPHRCRSGHSVVLGS